MGRWEKGQVRVLYDDGNRGQERRGGGGGEGREDENVEDQDADTDTDTDTVEENGE